MIALAERRTLLRAATTAEHREVMDLLRRAFDGADEAERTALARTLPPTRWLEQEGATPRAVLVLAALGSPAALAEALLPFATPAERRAVGPVGEALRAVVRPGVAGRSTPWATRWVDAIAENAAWNPWLAERLLADVIADHDLRPDSVTYLRHRVHAVLVDGTARPDAWFWEHDLWQVFRVDGVGGEWSLLEGEWEDALRARAAADPAFRTRLLTESLDGLLRDFPARSIVWYHRVHRLLEPTPVEARSLEGRYLAVLRTAPSASVGLAQEMLTRSLTSGAGDAVGLLDASRVVLGRTEKKVLTAQVRLLAALGKVAPEQAAAIGEVLAEALPTLPPDVAARARRRLPDAPAPVVPSSVPPRSVDAVVVPAPRATDLAPGPAHRPAVGSDEEALALVTDHLEGVGDGADLPRLVTWLCGTTVTGGTRDLPEPVIDRARAVLGDVWDDRGLSPRRHLAALLLARAGSPVPGPRVSGYVRIDFRRSLLDPRTFVERQRRVPTHAPAVVLARTLGQDTDDLRTAVQVRRRALGVPTCRSGVLGAPLAARPEVWERAPRLPEGGDLGPPRAAGWPAADRPWPFWRSDAAPPRRADDLAAALLDVAPVGSEAWWRVGSAREQDGFEQIVQWTTWVLRENPDALAAHAHPMLVAATVVANVRGVVPLLSALGGSRRTPGGPTWSALALALSARSAEHRAAAAEALATLAGSGLLDPVALAEQARLLLGEGFVMAGRIAGSAADAASISALAGYRVLQVLEALLPDVAGVTGGGRLVELAARLSQDYGTPVAVPEAWVAKGRGGSATAVAVRALLAVRPAATDLVVVAAAQARAAA